MDNIETYLIFVTGILLGSGLQIFLSRRKDKILGLILPIIAFLRSLNTIFNLSEWDLSRIEILRPFILVNIPTIIFIIIYILCRKRIQRNKEIEKMNIKDLN